MTKIKIFHQKKSLFLIQKNSIKLNFNIFFNQYFFKSNLLLKLFFKYFGWKNFNIFYLFFNNLSPKLLVTNTRVKKINWYIFFKYKFIYLYKNWKLLEYLYIPNLLRFKFCFLTKNFFCLRFFEIEFKKIFFNNCKFFFFTNQFLYLIIKKFNFIITKNEIFGENIKFIKQHKLYLNLLVYQNSKKYNNNFVKNYTSYQAFLNTNLYLTRSFIFTNTIGTASFDFLLLKNLNKFFFWIGDLKQNTFALEFLIWGGWNVIFWKGEPYLTYKLSERSSNLIPFYNFNWLILNENYNFDTIKYFNFNNFLYLN